MIYGLIYLVLGVGFVFVLTATDDNTKSNGGTYFIAILLWPLGLFFVAIAGSIFWVRGLCKGGLKEARKELVKFLRS